MNTGEETRALAPITAAGVVNAPPAAVFAFLSDLRNHWRLTGRWASLEGLDGPLNGPTGGTVIVRGPLGLRRRVQTSVVESRPANLMRGRAIVGSGGDADVEWQIAAVAGGQNSLVTLRVVVTRAGPVDRVLLSVGRRWLQHRFRDTIGHLDQVLGKAGPVGVMAAARAEDDAGVVVRRDQRPAATREHLPVTGGS